MKNKQRLDDFLVEQGFFDTKSKAQAAIMAGEVKINGQPAAKAGIPVNVDESPEIELKNMPYVSRGGFKLEKALKEFDINVKDKICLDAGASTGGFTDCLLQNGAKKVYAVDVGYGQLAWKLRQDERVAVIERTNVRGCSVSDVYGETDELAELAVMDLSFISITKVLANIVNLLNPVKKEIISLIKPQFEAGKDQVPKTGVIKDKKVHLEVIKNVVGEAKKIGLNPLNLTFSPIKGPAGNIEYLIHLANKDFSLDDTFIENVVEKAHENLSGKITE